MNLQCKNCQREGLSLDDFYKTPTGKPRGTCALCTNSKSVKHRKARITANRLNRDALLQLTVKSLESLSREDLARVFMQVAVLVPGDNPHVP